ncbi:MAG: hypothetical protein L6R19_27910 [Alphaproteobacteria bacterium]|nr:hypothetical protein [Alphaproteobacteria bacterium]
MEGEDSARSGRGGLGPYPTTQVVQARIAQARRMRDDAWRAAVGFMVAAAAAGVRQLAYPVLHWLAQRLARRPRAHDAAYTASRTD